VTDSASWPVRAWPESGSIVSKEISWLKTERIDFSWTFFFGMLTRRPLSSVFTI
jgi:hypothetical protein